MKNIVEIEGTLTKEPYFAEKGWCAGTLAVGDGDFRPWVQWYCPAAKAAVFEGAQRNEAFAIKGKLAQKKDKSLQVEVIEARPLAVNSKGEVKRPGNTNTQIDDSDLPF